MLSFLKRLVNKWSAWVGDRDMELAIRKSLDGYGYYGDSARFNRLRLSAVQRPGWLQVFLFSVEAKPRIPEDAKFVEVYGIVRQDERYDRVETQVFTRISDRDAVFEEWSAELIRLRGR